MADIVLLSIADWDNPFWTNKQHVAVELAKRGHRVFYIDSLGLRRPSASSQDISRIRRRLQKAVCAPRAVRKNLWVWSPVILPFHSNAIIRRTNQYLLSRWLDYWLRRLAFHKDILWTYNPLTTQLLNFRQFNKLVYHCVDEIKAQPGMPKEALEQAEQVLVQEASIVFVTAPKLLETRRRWNRNTYYLPNVADYAHFSTAMDEQTALPDDLAAIPAPRIGFVGAISGYKVDFRLLRLVAAAHPEWSLVLIGKVGEGDPWTDFSLLHGLANIHLLGAKPYDDLPQYLHGIDVAILPNQLNEYTEAMFPMKFFEYLAAGRRIVSVDLPALREFSDVAYIAKTPADFVTGIAQTLAGQGAPLEARLSLAKEYTYEARTEKMMSLIQQFT